MRPISAKIEFHTNALHDRTADKFVGDENWFAEVCHHLFEHKPGTALHCVTGYDERSCQRYAAGAVKPPAYFLRQLLRNEGGFTWLCAIMDGCDAVWWQELQLAIEIVELVRDRRRNRGRGKPGAPDDP